MIAHPNETRSGLLRFAASAIPLEKDGIEKTISSCKNQANIIFAKELRHYMAGYEA